MNGLDLGHYRIEVQLGAGGMGAVYRASDLRTGKIVALKTLLASRLEDIEQRRRFQQEARLASSLDHPNIVTFFEIGNATIDNECVDYIAMELVDGDTLEKRVEHHPLSQAQTLDYGIQLAHGLAAAHAANIVHRDLKPSNIMLTKDGVIKILDFGLAKWTDPLQPDSFSETRSVQLGLTMAGTIVGSVAYMSPEQAEGKPLDSRTDIFSFGSVLYRLVSGQEPFKGTSQVATLSAVLLKDPEPLSDLSAGIDLRLENIIRKCLRKDPAKRWQSMADLALSLEELRDELNQPRGAPQAIAMPPAAGSTRRLWLTAGAALFTGLLPSAYFATRRASPATFQRLTYRRGDILGAQFAPRGEIVYTAHWDGSPRSTFSSLPGSREARDLGLPAAGRLLAINSSGEALMINGDGDFGTLIRVGLGGGAPRSVLDNVSDARWGLDGNSLAVIRMMGAKFRVEYPIGTVLYQSDVRPPICLRLNPLDGTIAFFDFDSEVGDYDVKLIDSSKQIKVISRGWKTTGRLCWSPDGKEIFLSGGRPGQSPQLTAVSREGKERTLAELPGFMVLHDVAPDGSLLAAAVRSKIALSTERPGTNDDIDLSWFDASKVYDISDDGQTVLFVELAYGESRNSAIYVRKTDGSPAVKIGYGNRPALSPDGKQVVCIFRQDKSSLLKILSTGSGEDKLLPTDGMKYDYAEWFPDRQRLLVTASAPGKPLRSYWRSLEDNQVHAVSPEGVRTSQVSPDSKWTVGVLGGRFQLFPIQQGEPTDLVAAEPGDQPLRWASNGSGFYVAQAQGSTVQIDLIDVAAKQRRKIREIRLPEEGSEFVGIAISPDAKWYAMSYQKDMAELYIARGIK